jgi:hypothetical protein
MVMTHVDTALKVSSPPSASRVSNHPSPDVVIWLVSMRESRQRPSSAKVTDETGDVVAEAGVRKRRRRAHMTFLLPTPLWVDEKCAMAEVERPAPDGHDHAYVVRHSTVNGTSPHLTRSRTV